MGREFHCYVLRSRTTGRFYIGHTHDLEDRLERHQTNRSFATKGRGPWVLVCAESFVTRADAVRRERQLKKWKSRVGLEKLIGTSRKRG